MLLQKLLIGGVNEFVKFNHGSGRSHKKRKADQVYQG